MYIIITAILVVLAILILSIKDSRNDARIETFVESCLKQDYAAVKLQLEKGIDINACASEKLGGAAALHLVAASGDTKMTSFLLKNDANPNIQSIGMGLTPLFGCCEHPKVVQILLEAGANPNIRAYHRQFTAIFNAIGNFESIELLLNAGADPNIIETGWGNTPLYCACLKQVGDATLELLLDSGANPNLPSPLGISIAEVLVMAGKGDLLDDYSRFEIDYSFPGSISSHG